MFKIELTLEQHGFELHGSIYPWIYSVICVTVPHDLQLTEFMGPVPQIWRKYLYGGQTISYTQLCRGWALLISMLFEGWLISQWTKYFTHIKHHINIWDSDYKITEQMEIKLQEPKNSFQIWVCTLKI